MFEFWTPLTKAYEDVLLAAAVHPDGMALTTEKIARVLVKRGLVERYGSGRVCISEKGLTLLIERRDDVAYRKLRGSPLSPRETVLLQKVDAVLRRRIPRAEPLPQDVRDAMAQVRRLRDGKTAT